MDTTLSQRLMRALALEPELFTEVGADATATRQALLLVFGIVLLSGLGELPVRGAAGFLYEIALGCLGWSLWVVGIQATAHWLGYESELAPLFRALGFAAAPFLLGLFEELPWIGELLRILKWGVGIAAFGAAVRALLAVEWSTALLLVLVGLGSSILLCSPLLWLSPA